MKWLHVGEQARRIRPTGTRGDRGQAEVSAGTIVVAAYSEAALTLFTRNVEVGEYSSWDYAIVIDRKVARVEPWNVLFCALGKIGHRVRLSNALTPTASKNTELVNPRVYKNTTTKKPHVDSKSPPVAPDAYNYYYLFGRPAQHIYCVGLLASTPLPNPRLRLHEIESFIRRNL
ncbi:MAG: hypothetical protein MMC33_001547 [Icmadophila ericetorum]|nr:hypothetical protein [Icmadophila ericetorum]